jgi:guanine deaminase
MNMNCPEYLRTDETTWQGDTEALARDFGRRVIVTDRFAVAVDSNLRLEAAGLASRLNLRMQTHLNEQTREKDSVEHTLYPDAGTYTNVYERDGLLARDAILAHCVWMHPSEWERVARRRAAIAHCPTSNTLLGSGVMDLSALARHGIEYALCTDVGASPTTSLLVEMAQFLKVHHGYSDRATPSEALYRGTLAPAKILHIDDQLGRLEPGRPMSFVEIACDVGDLAQRSTDDVILTALLDMSAATLDNFTNDPLCRRSLESLRRGSLDIGPELQCLCDDVAKTVARLENKVRRVVIGGKVVQELRV